MRQAGYVLTVLLVVLAFSSTGCPPAPPPVNTATAPTTTGPVTDPLEKRMYEAIQMIAKRELDPSHGFWTVFHGILGLGPDLMLNDKKAGKKVKALDYIRMGGEMPGLRFDIRSQGLDVYTAAAPDMFFAQGHQDQFVAEMAQWGVPLSLPFKVYDKDYKFSDFVNYSKFRASVTRKQELAWAILIVSEYEGTQVSWTNQFNESLTLEDMVRYELDSPMDPDEAVKIGQLPLACGGTHRLFGLSWALNVHLQNGGKLTGIWKRIDDKLNTYKTTVKNIRNEDGSFSTNYLVKKGNVSDIGTRMSTTGHTFEWLALAARDSELREPWMEDAASYLTKLVYDVQLDPVEGGALYHAVHGLLMYYARVYGTEKLGPYAPYMRLAPGNKPVVRKTS
ncbi:MAG: hypothetical protein JNJ77_13975 [Planctomycetia bacterium]|nr:hypothetical protein [Planctomycetia bacterium]